MAKGSIALHELQRARLRTLCLGLPEGIIQNGYLVDKGRFRGGNETAMPAYSKFLCPHL